MSTIFSASRSFFALRLADYCSCNAEVLQWKMSRRNRVKEYRTESLHAAFVAVLPRIVRGKRATDSTVFYVVRAILVLLASVAIHDVRRKACAPVWYVFVPSFCACYAYMSHKTMHVPFVFLCKHTQTETIACTVLEFNQRGSGLDCCTPGQSQDFRDPKKVLLKESSSVY